MRPQSNLNRGAGGTSSKVVNIQIDRPMTTQGHVESVRVLDSAGKFLGGERNIHRTFKRISNMGRGPGDVRGLSSGGLASTPKPDEQALRELFDGQFLKYPKPSLGYPGNMSKFAQSSKSPTAMTNGTHTTGTGRPFSKRKESGAGFQGARAQQRIMFSHYEQKRPQTSFVKQGEAARGGGQRYPTRAHHQMKSYESAQHLKRYSS